VRTTSFTSPTPLAPGDPVLHAGRAIGEVLAAGWSHTLGAVAGIALVETPLAHPHIDAFTVRGASGETAIRTRTPPLVNNRSLYVDPHRHAYQTRAADAFPPLVLA
jgi:glycine cleavage system aminomethyltransferase T